MAKLTTLLDKGRKEPAMELLSKGALTLLVLLLSLCTLPTFLLLLLMPGRHMLRTAESISEVLTVAWDAAVHRLHANQRGGLPGEDHSPSR